VAALATARHAVASHRARGDPITAWLDSQTRLHGIGENAAVLAVMEVPEYHHQTAQAYALQNPDRLDALHDLLAAPT
jgi:hypothetical protein